MEKKRGRNRAAVRRLWRFLGVLWLVTVCLAGCGASGNSPGNQAGENRRAEAAVSEAADTEAWTREADNQAAPARETEVPKMQADETGDGELQEAEAEGPEGSEGAAGVLQTIEESGVYTSKDEVALYLHTYGRLPRNYITKRDAQDLGWDSKKGNLWDVAPGMSIGGSPFGNYEGALPEKKGRKYFECDIDYEGGYRGAKRLIYSDDGLIFYTEDHYGTFEQMYGE